MIPLFVAAALAAPIRLDRVDVLAEDPGTWLNYDAPMAPYAATQTAVRFVEQVSFVVATPAPDLYVGLSFASQSVRWERVVWKDLDLHAGVQTSLLLPRGAFAGAGWTAGRLHVAGGVSAVSNATWARPDWTHWSAMPTVGVGVKVGKREKGPATN